MTKYAIWVHGTFDSPCRSESHSRGLFGGSRSRGGNFFTHDYIGAAGTSDQLVHTLHDFKLSGYHQMVTCNDLGREKELTALLWPQVPDVVCLAFVWSGHADESARREGGRLLAHNISRLPPDAEVAIAGHSHGGNVIGHALNQDTKLHFAKTYLFATPFFGSWGNGLWKSTPELIWRAGEAINFVQPTDMVQTWGATAVGFWNAYDDCVGFKKVFIEPNHVALLRGTNVTDGETGHTSMSSSQAFRMAAKAIGAAGSSDDFTL